MTRFYLVRHGQSEGNLENTFLGHSDRDLSPRGHKQAALAGEFLKDKGIEVIYSSDLCRAYNTALPTAKACGLPVIRNEQLRELFAGEWENRKYDELLAAYPEEYGTFIHDIGRAVCTGGESVAELSERVYAEFCRIAEKEKGRTVALFTHATPIRALIGHFMGVPVFDLKDIRWVGNASVSCCEVDDDGKVKLIYANYQEHLAGIATEFGDNV